MPGTNEFSEVLPLDIVHIVTEDPGAVGPGQAWVNPDTGQFAIRNRGDNGWIYTAAGIQKAVVTLTDAQVKALPTASVDLIAGVPGKVILPLYMILRINKVAGYDDVSADGMIFVKYGNGNVMSYVLNDSGDSILELTAFLTGTGPARVVLVPNMQASLAWGLYGLGAEAPGSAGESLSIEADNGAVDFTAGDAGNSLQITIIYALEEV